MERIVGNIQGYDVIYVPEKDMIFCKNTIVRYVDLNRALFKSTLDRECVQDKLSVVKDKDIVYLGCLTVSRDTILQIKSNIKQIKNNERNKK